MNKSNILTINMYQWNFSSFIMAIFSLHMLHFITDNELFETFFLIGAYFLLIVYGIYIFNFDFRDWRIVKDTNSIQKFIEFGMHIIFLTYILISLMINFYGYVFSESYQSLINPYDENQAFRNPFIQISFFVIVIILPITHKLIDSIKPIRYHKITIDSKYKLHSIISILMQYSLYFVFGIFLYIYSSYYFTSLPKLDLRVEQISMTLVFAVYSIVMPLFVMLLTNNKNIVTPKFEKKWAYVSYIFIISIYTVLSVIALLVALLPGILLLVSVVGNHFFLAIITKNQNPIKEDEQVIDDIIYCSVVYASK